MDVLWEPCSVVHKASQKRFSRDQQEFGGEMGRLNRKIWGFGVFPGESKMRLLRKSRPQLWKALNAVSKLLDPVSHRQSGEHFKQRMIWKQEIHGKFMENKSFMDKIHQRVWIFLFYIFYFEYTGNVKGVETDSSQPPLNTAKYLSWKNNKHF